MTRSRQRLTERLFWFGVGAVLNYLLITLPFAWLAERTTWPVWVVSACSVGVASALLFAWNVLVNFRGNHTMSSVLPRYVTAAVIMWILSSAVLTLLKHVDVSLASRLGDLLDFDVIGTQVFLAGIKFTLYHTWVFPAGKPTGVA